MERWTGRVAIVTGASSGIGAATAKKMVQAGMRVVGVARREDKIKSLAAELKSEKGQLFAMACDVTKEEDIKRVVKWTRDVLGGADVLVNNAGVWYQAPFLESNGELLRKMIDTNMWGLIMFIKEVTLDIRERGVSDGHIVNIASIAGHRLLNCPGIGAYCATKHGVTVISEALRQELRDLGTRIRVTNISPGVVKTDLFSALEQNQARAQEMFQVNPHLHPEDIADGIIYALSTPPHVQVQEITIEPVGEKI
ncbi:farnesol dehydrogenase [Neocloeon triangulifer]|uniref:farnesol dehydrogenase n=1 Tax=Neocloeon triangulifer TaxID=2078957 RepID=UPI00286F3465|nr:farnesol dehydrogenase [Neocloeon triangulifer]